MMPRGIYAVNRKRMEEDFGYQNKTIEEGEYRD
jgi:hypothetical protein